MQDKEAFIECIRSILFNWAELSAGDISTIGAVLNDPGARVVTVEGSAHFRFWAELERLGWAARVHLPLPKVDGTPRATCFAITPSGVERVPALMERYDLKPGTFYADGRHPPAGKAAAA
jgi:hypothetical protein